MRALRWGACLLFLAMSCAACDLPFGLGLATTRALEDGATSALDGASSFEISGSYLDSGARWMVDLQLARPDAQRIVLSGSDPAQTVEAVVLGKNGYFRGRDFLVAHVGSDPVSQILLGAVGDAWWKGTAADAPKLPDLTRGDGFRSTFLGPAMTQRTDHLSVDGLDAVYLAGPRAELWMMAGPPYQPLRLRLRRGVSVDGLTEADLRYGSFDRDFRIAAPTNVIDFSNLSSLPPLYTVVSVDVSRCMSPCVVSALVKNLGSTQRARDPSTVSFVLKDNASGKTLGSCQASVVPDVGYNATTTVSCTIAGTSGGAPGADTVTATPNNPGRA